MAAPTEARTWSPQQEAIFKWFARDQHTTDNPPYLNVETMTNPNLQVIARAGTGKTTTIIEGANRAPERNILMCAFNKRIQEELSTRIRNPRAEAKTLHALGYAQVRDFWEGVKVAKRVEDRAASLTDLAILQLGVTAPPEQIKRLISKLHTLGREMAPHAAQRSDLENIALQFECEPDELTMSSPGMAQFDLDYICMVALRAMEIAATDEALAKRTGIDFADMLYLPVRNGWMTPEYDLVIVDEAQDMTVTQLELALGVVTNPSSDGRKPGGRVCIVGDDRQAIYGFRGADSNSMARLRDELNAIVLPLTVTYRCGAAIVKQAQTLVPDFTAAPTNPTGKLATLNLSHSGSPDLTPLISACDPYREDFILSRKNAPLARVAMGFIRAGVRVRVQGRDIGAGLRALVERLTRSHGSIPAMLTALETWEAKEIARAEKKNRTDLIMAIQDKAETLRVLADSVTGPAELLARIDGLFSDSGRNQVVCSSVHKAKGLEASHVFILADTLYPRFAMKTEAGASEEANIEYVAISRAINSLTYVYGVA